MPKKTTDKPSNPISVNIYLGDRLIAPEDVSKLRINSVAVDRIVNETIRRASTSEQITEVKHGIS